MNYKEMLDQFEFLERRIAHVENENKHLRERVLKLEGAEVKAPAFTPGTLPNTNVWTPRFWSFTTTGTTTK
jgi:cell shape-determining protein MreC